MQIDDIVYSLTIDGQALPDKGCSITELQIIEKYEYAVPCLIIRIQDEANMIGRTIILNDGSLLSLTWGQGDNVFTHDFRVATYKVNASANTYYYDVIAWYDNVKWFVDCNNKSYEGTSSEVIAKLAQECGMKADCDPTEDKQKWIAGNDPNYLFARKIAKKGYGGDNSLMSITTCLGVIRYKDMNKLDDNGPILGFAHGLGVPKKMEVTGYSVTCFPMTSLRIHLKSGVYNLIHGYKTVMRDPNIDKPNQDKQIEDAPVKSRTTSIAVNPQIKGQVSTPSLQTGGIKTDNTHDNYNGAQYSNNRGTYVLRNAKVEFTTNFLTNVTVFDPIVLRISGTNIGATSSADNEASQFDGPYIVYCRTIFISGNVYAEKIICDREGVMG